MGDFIHGNFTVTQKESPESVREFFAPCLIHYEKIELVFLGPRNKVVFTSNKIICYCETDNNLSMREFHFFPISKISTFRVEAPGYFGDAAKLRVYLIGNGYVDIHFGKGVYIKEVVTFLASVVH
jgi:hypothetical protein